MTGDCYGRRVLNTTILWPHTISIQFILQCFSCNTENQIRNRRNVPHTIKTRTLNYKLVLINYNNSYIFSFLYHIGSGNSLGEVENYNNRFLVIRWSSTSVIIHTIMYGIWVYFYILYGIYITYQRRLCVSLFLSWKFLLILFIVLLGPGILTFIILYIYIINQIWILLTSYQIWIFYPCTYGHSVFIIINNYMVFQKANPSRIL
eukprot:87906_1